MIHSSLEGWQNTTLVYLGVKGLKQLENLKFKLECEGIQFVEFKEPDIGYETTAIASDVDCEIFSKMNLI